MATKKEIQRYVDMPWSYTIEQEDGHDEDGMIKPMRDLRDKLLEIGKALHSGNRNPCSQS